MSENNYIDIELENGKYNVIMPESGRLHALRYGEKWRDLCGDNLVYYLAVELQEAREKIESAKNCLVCASIGDAMEVCINTLNILEDKNA